MAYEGANNTTQAEFEKVFGFKEDNSKFIEEIEQLKKVAEISNSVWILKDYKILKSYTDKMKSSFDAEPYFTDFKKDPDGSAEKINAWIEESTNGMIKKMLDGAAVVKFKMALVNAIYFKQGWKSPFNKKATKKDKFTNLDGDIVRVDMMRAQSYYKAYNGANEKVIELPYEDDKTSMVVVLPNNMEGYEMTNANYIGINAGLYTQEVNLSLVKFTFETPTFELKSLLQELGLVSAFENGADFSGMRKEKDLKIGTALHKAKIIVNEEGTEAAAATVVGMIQTTSVHIKPPVMQFVVDKPFYYFIKDIKTGAILFMGRMNEMENLKSEE